MATEKVLTLTDDNFEEKVLKSDVPVLVDFTATWCGPCRTIAPIIDQLASEYDGRVVVGKVDIDQNPGVTSRNYVRSVPTVLLYANGAVQNSQVGAASKKRFVSMLEDALR